LAFLDRREPGEALAVYRILLGLNVFWAVMSVWAPGLVPVLWLQPEAGGMRPLRDGGSWLVGALGGPTPEVVWPLVVGTVVASVLLILGVASRLMALLCLQGFLAVAWINGHAGGSYDGLLTNALWLLALARSDATVSLTCRLRTGSWRAATLVPAWPRWLVALQLVVMYTSTGLQKVSASWVPGGDSSALYYILQQPSWARADFSWVAHVFPLAQAATLSVWLFEVGAPVLLLLLWFRHTRDRPGRLRAVCNRLDGRSVFVAYGALMHIGIHVTMAVGPFSTVCLALYACLFSGDEWAAALDRVGQRARARATPPPTAPTPPAGSGPPAA
jgi:uncharacterized membrane protein YphA (DoxX/SURF4 family)